MKVWDEERWGNKLLVLSGEPQLIAPIPSQGVDVVTVNPNWTLRKNCRLLTQPKKPTIKRAFVTANPNWTLRKKSDYQNFTFLNMKVYSKHIFNLNFSPKVSTGEVDQNLWCLSQILTDLSKSVVLESNILTSVWFERPWLWNQQSDFRGESKNHKYEKSGKICKFS